MITRVNEHLDQVQAAINEYRLAASSYSHGIYCKTEHNKKGLVLCNKLTMVFTINFVRQSYQQCYS